MVFIKTAYLLLNAKPEAKNMENTINHTIKYDIDYFCCFRTAVF